MRRAGRSAHPVPSLSHEERNLFLASLSVPLVRPAIFELLGRYESKACAKPQKERRNSKFTAPRKLERICLNHAALSAATGVLFNVRNHALERVQLQEMGTRKG